jgi:hypothetical protein
VRFAAVVSQAGFLAGLLAGLVPAPGIEASWLPLPGLRSLPKDRGEYAVAYDAAGGQVPLFGGQDGSAYPDTGVWDGSNWVRQYPSGSPSAGACHATTYDPLHGQVVLVGGLDRNDEPSLVGTKIAYLAPYDQAGNNSG